MAWNSQNVFKVRNLVLSDKKQKAWGTPITDAEMLRRVEFDSNAYVNFGIAFDSDQARVGKGSSFPTVRWATQQTTEFQNLAFDVDDYLAGWIAAFALGKEAVAGAGPYTHTITFNNSDGDAIATTVYSEDTSALQRKFLDMCVNTAQFSGSGRGPVQATVSLLGTGKETDGAMGGGVPAIPTRKLIMFMDTQFLIGPPGAPVAIDPDRVQSWQVSINNNLTARSGPGSGLTSNKLTVGQQVAEFNAVIFAKETDDLVTLLKNQTEQEIQINIATAADATLKFDFPAIFLSAAQVGTQDGLVVLNISSDQNSILKSGANEPLTITVINDQASYLTLAA